MSTTALRFACGLPVPRKCREELPARAEHIIPISSHGHEKTAAYRRGSPRWRRRTVRDDAEIAVFRPSGWVGELAGMGAERALEGLQMVASVTRTKGSCAISPETSGWAGYPTTYSGAGCAMVSVRRIVVMTNNAGLSVFTGGLRSLLRGFVPGIADLCTLG
jgi:hypothetical protein